MRDELGCETLLEFKDEIRQFQKRISALEGFTGEQVEGQRAALIEGLGNVWLSCSLDTKAHATADDLFRAVLDDHAPRTLESILQGA